MVKAKEFLHYLSEELNYRIFLGPEIEGFLPLYKHMKPSFMNYMPTVNETVALGVAIGNSIGGYNSCVLTEAKNLYDLVTPIRDFAINYKTPLLIITHTVDENKFPLKIPQARMEVENVLRYKEKLKRLVSMTHKKMLPGILFIEEGILE